MVDIVVVVLLVLGAILHGVTGLGFPMVSTMSVAIIFPLPVAIVLVTFPNVVINLMVLAPGKRGRARQGILFFIGKYRLMILSSFVGCIAGVLLLKTLPMGWMYLLLSIATLFYVFYTFFNRKISLTRDKKSHGQLKHNGLKMVFFGGLAGVVGGATNAMSSIMMMYLLAASDNKNEIVKTSNFCFLLAKIVQIVMLKDELTALDGKALWALPLVTMLSTAALFVGIVVRDRISIIIFKRMVLIMLLTLSARAAWNAVLLLLL